MSAPYVWIKAVDKVYLDDPKFSAVLDGVADDSAALQAAINATAFGFNSTRKRQLILPDNADIRIRSKVTVGACLGFSIVGGGAGSTRFIIDPLTPFGDGLVINSSQHTVLEGFALLGKQSNPAGKMLSYDYSPPGSIASYGHALRDVWITSDDTRMAYETGIWFSSALGNNSRQR